MSLAALDDIDREIVRQLQRDGRLSNRDLARALSMSESACWRRVQRLEGEGFIAGYAALLGPAASLHNVRAWIEIRLDEAGFARAEELETTLRDDARVAAAYRTIEHGAYLVKVGAVSLSDMERVTAELSSVACVSAPLQRWLVVRDIKPLAQKLDET